MQKDAASRVSVENYAQNHQRFLLIAQLKMKPKKNFINSAPDSQRK